MEEKTIIALEIGSSKIKGAIGTVDPSGLLSVKAVEEEKIYDIVRYGCIRNVVETASAVRNVVSRLEQREAPRKIERVYVSLGGRSLTSESIDIERRYSQETEITREIIKEITEEALSRELPDHVVVKALPKELRVDNAPTARPVGMYGQQISARLNLVSCRSQLLKNLVQVIETRMGLKIADIIVRPLAEADLVLLSDEKRLGCMMVDFGAETTTVAIYKNGVLQHLAVLPMGSRNITRDITALNHLEEKAEELKIAFGNALPGTEMTGIRPADNTDIAAVNNYVSARAGEILMNVVEQIKYAGLTPDKLPAGVVVIGRGARLAGFTNRLEQILPGMKVRMGIPDNKVRILDGRIQSADAVDVIAVLSEAAHNEPVECLSPRPIVTQPVATQQSAPSTRTETRPETRIETRTEAHSVTEQRQQTVYQHPYQGNNRPVEEPIRTTTTTHQRTQAATTAGEAPRPVNPYTGAKEKSALSKLADRWKLKFAEIFTEEVDDED